MTRSLNPQSSHRAFLNLRLFQWGRGRICLCFQHPSWKKLGFEDVVVVKIMWCILSKVKFLPIPQSLSAADLVERILCRDCLVSEDAYDQGILWGSSLQNRIWSQFHICKLYSQAVVPRFSENQDSWSQLYVKEREKGEQDSPRRKGGETQAGSAVLPTVIIIQQLWLVILPSLSSQSLDYRCVYCWYHIRCSWLWLQLFCLLILQILDLPLPHSIQVQYCYLFCFCFPTLHVTSSPSHDLILILFYFFLYFFKKTFCLDFFTTSFAAACKLPLLYFIR